MDKNPCIGKLRLPRAPGVQIISGERQVELMDGQSSNEIAVTTKKFLTTKTEFRRKNFPQIRMRVRGIRLALEAALTQLALINFKNETANQKGII
jgi:hypothetical protein